MKYKTLQNNITKTATAKFDPIEYRLLNYLKARYPESTRPKIMAAQAGGALTGAGLGGLVGLPLGYLGSGIFTEDKKKRRRAALLTGILGAVLGGYKGYGVGDDRADKSILSDFYDKGMPLARLKDIMV